MALIGCATMKLPTLQLEPTSSYPNHAETNRIAVAVRALTEKEAVKDTFGINLLKKDIVPVLIIVENMTGESSIMVHKDKITVTDIASGRTLSTQRTKVASETLGNNTVFSGVFVAGGAFAIMAGAKMISDAQVIEYNLSDKQLYNHTVGPGQRTAGFVYLRHPAGESFSGRYQLLLELSNAAHDDIVTYMFRL
jgi:hypothetical protein